MLPDIPYHEDLATLSQQVASILNNGPGACIIRDFPLLADDQALLELTYALGNPLQEARNLNGQAVCLVEVEPHQAIPTYANTPYEFPCHTDCADLADPPDTVILLCEQPAASGGESYLTALEPVLARLSSQDREMLAQPLFLFCEQWLPILFGPAHQPNIRYNRVMLEIARRLHELPTDQVFALLNRVDAALAECQTAFRLEAGDCLILNNHHQLHGRGKFPPDSHRRLRRVRLDRGAAPCS